MTGRATYLHVLIFLLFVFLLLIVIIIIHDLFLDKLALALAGRRGDRLRLASVGGGGAGDTSETSRVKSE